MNKSKYILLLVIVFFTCGKLRAQFYQTGQPPASVKWMETNTSNFRLIYPETFSSKVNRMAALLEESWDFTGHTLSHQPDRIPVIVHNHGARSNGLVVWAPKRMEIYPLPPQRTRGGDWLTQLAVHEQRHVVQVDMLKRGMTGVLYYLLGEQATGMVAGHLPLWFLEGDAVTTETTLTKSGRGRSASFEMPVRALVQSNTGHYNYDKFVLGSYKDYVPDPYRYGYLMVSSLRREYGPGIWENTLDYIGRWPVDLAAFGRSLKRQTGMGPARLHEKVLGEIRVEWDSLYGERQWSDYRILNRRESDLYHSYRYPAWLGDTAVIALKSGVGQIEEFVIVDMEGEEKNVHFPGHLSAPSISVSGSRFAWSEYLPDPRWGLREYSVIKLFDLHTGKERSLSSRSRYFSPAFAPDGLFLAVVEIDYENRHSLNIINSVTGESAESFPAPEEVSIQQPVFHPDGKKIFFTSAGPEGMAVTSFNFKTGLWQNIIEPSFVNISGLFSCGTGVCFNSDISGIDELYALDTDAGTLQQLTGVEYGAFDGNLSASINKLVWSGYTADGYDLALSGFSPISPDYHNGDTLFRRDLLKTLVSHERGIVTGDKKDNTEWTAKPYKKGVNIFNFHSWSPFYFDYSELNIEELPVYPGVTLLSQNLLNTANTFLGYSYHQGNHVAHGTFIYKGWYPVMEAGFDYGDRPMVFTGRDTLGPQDLSDYNQLNISGKAYIPLNFSSGRYVAGMEPRLRINYNNSFYHYEKEDIYKRGMTTTDMRLTAYRYLRRSRMDLAPGWGQVLRLTRRSSPFESENLGSVNAAELTLYAPGLLARHSLRLDAAMQRQNPEKYYFSSLVSFPRGYRDEKSDQLDLVRSSYSFPLAYPDFSVRGLVYIKRVHAGIFSDYGVNRVRVLNSRTNRIEWHEEELFSWGSTLTVNFHFLRLMFPFNMSGGFAHIPGRGETSFLFSLGVNLDVF